MNYSTDLSQAEIYDTYFLPALFQQWGEKVSQIANIQPGDSVLDVACGTGALAYEAAKRLSSDDYMVGLDPNDEMLSVARQKNANVEWRVGMAEELPFPDHSFNKVVSQFGFMFFENQIKALHELQRVLTPGGYFAIAVCDALDHSSGYSVLAELLHRLFGHEVAESFRAPFNCGNENSLMKTFESAGIPNATVNRHVGTVRFNSISDLVATERACAFTLGGILNDEQFNILQDAAEVSLRPFVTTEGHIEFEMPVLIVSGQLA